MREARADRRAGTVAGSITACGQHCGGEVAASGATEQIQLAVPVTAPILTRFDIALGRCSRCGRAVRGRHPRQTSEAVGAAGVQLGPRLRTYAAMLRHEQGLSFKKIARVL